MPIDVSSSFAIAPDFIGAISSGVREAVHGGRSDRPHRPGASPAPNENKPVLTPGGPRPAKDVHRVGPGQQVQQNPDGSFSVAPIERPRNGNPPKTGGDHK